MILDELVLHNFGVYRGRQSINLTPISNQRPVILFGGLNGGGKTTLLDGLQLALFGKAAHCSNRGTLAYNDFLERSINSRVSKGDGAALEIEFRHRSEGIESTYRVNRSWHVSSSGVVRERLDVLKDGREDPVLAEQWSEHVDEFMPAGISNLFLFDGEKIEGLAEVESSSRLLASAIGALLGLDLVDQLSTDLVVLERRKRMNALSDEDRRTLELLAADIEMLEQRVRDLSDDQAAARNECEFAEKALGKLDARFQKEGGDLYERRLGLETKRTSLAQQIEETESELCELAAGVLPFAAVSRALSAVRTQDAKEQEAEHARALARILEERDARIAAELRKQDRGVASWLTTFLAQDRQTRAKSVKLERYLNLNSDARSLLAALDGFLDDSKRRARELMRKLEKLRNNLDRIDRKLAGVPTPELIQSLHDEREAARSRVDTTKAKFDVVETELEKARRSFQVKKDQQARELEQRVKRDFSAEAALRIVHHAQRVRSTLGLFRERLINRHVKRIEQLILESFQQLLRKQTLISALTIDPKTFAVQLRDRDGQMISADRLSAGERQLLAISMLWGLARASGRPLPAVIDTPLGRLDSTHRCHLVRRYFPFASHQVLLLSTDEEIDQHYFQELRPHVGRSYLLDFDEKTSTTSVREGYFW